MAEVKVALIEPVGGHGGMDHYDYGLAQGLAASGVTVQYHTCSETEERDIEGVETLTTFGQVWKSANKWVKLWRYLIGHWNALRQAKATGCTVVHLHFFSFDWLNFLVTLIVNRFGFKKVLTIHDVSDFRGGGSAIPRKYILSSFDHFIVHNDFSRRQLEEIHDGQNISVIPHGHYLHSVNELPYVPDATKPLQLLFFGQIKKVKGLDVLLTAMGRVTEERPDVHLTIAGKVWHDDLAHYENLIEEMNLREHVTAHFSFIPNDEVAEYFQKADAVVLPYRQIYQSGVLLLSMSYGRAVITSDLEPFSEVLDDRVTGYLFNSEDPVSLSRTIVDLAENREQLTRLAKNASEKLKSYFDWHGIGRDTHELYKSL